MPSLRQKKKKKKKKAGDIENGLVLLILDLLNKERYPLNKKKKLPPVSYLDR
jgi:hypothetical protein